MPIYEYQCDNCHELFEVMQKFADEPLTTHEKCGGTAHRLLSVPALQFKGTGWYVTDYAKSSGSPAASSSSKPNADSGSSSTSSSDSKSTSSESKSSSSESKPGSSSETK